MTFKNKREKREVVTGFVLADKVWKLYLSAQVQQCDNNSALNKGNLFRFAPWNVYWLYKDHWKDDGKGIEARLW